MGRLSLGLWTPRSPHSLPTSRRKNIHKSRRTSKAYLWATYVLPCLRSSLSVFALLHIVVFVVEVPVVCWMPCQATNIANHCLWIPRIWWKKPADCVTLSTANLLFFSWSSNLVNPMPSTTSIASLGVIMTTIPKTRGIPKCHKLQFAMLCALALHH